MMPFVYIPTKQIPIPFTGWTLPIQPFVVMVTLALIVGYYLCRRRATKVGLDREIVADSIIWLAVGGFVVGHLVALVFYHPERILEDPLQLVYVWSGLSSFGGFIGAAGGTVWFYRRLGLPVLPYLDTLFFGAVPGWILGRTGCSLAHDHPGKVTDFFLGVRCHRFYNRFWTPGITRHDLGLYEMLYSIVLTTVLYGFKNVYPFPGFHAALVLLLYAPMRFGWDFLRVADKTYLGLTPGHFFSLAMFAGGLVLAYNGKRLRQQGTDGRAALDEAIAAERTLELAYRQAEDRAAAAQEATAEGPSTKPASESHEGVDRSGSD